MFDLWNVCLSDRLQHFSLVVSCRISNYFTITVSVMMTYGVCRLIEFLQLVTFIIGFFQSPSTMPKTKRHRWKFSFVFPLPHCQVQISSHLTQFINTDFTLLNSNLWNKHFWVWKRENDDPEPVSNRSFEFFAFFSFSSKHWQWDIWQDDLLASTDPTQISSTSKQ